MHALRIRSFAYFAAGIAVTVAAAWSLSAWRASAAVDADESTFVAVQPSRILDTRSDLGLTGPFVSAIPQDLRVTGTVPVDGSGAKVVVPAGATGVMLNVTAVSPTADGFVSIRPADAPGLPTTSNLNFKAGDIVPNAVTVQIPTSGADAGRIEITFDAFGTPGPTTDILVDLVGYTKNAGLASLQAQVNALQAAALLDGDPAGGDLAGTYPSPGLGANSVGPAELANGTVGLAEMNAVIVEDQAVDTDAEVAAGTCSNDIAVTVTDAPADSRTLVLVSRPEMPTADNDWIAAGGSPSAAGTANIVICNNGAANAAPDPMLVDFILLGP